MKLFNIYTWSNRFFHLHPPVIPIPRSHRSDSVSITHEWPNSVRLLYIVFKVHITRLQQLSSTLGHTCTSNTCIMEEIEEGLFVLCNFRLCNFSFYSDKAIRLPLQWLVNTAKIIIFIIMFSFINSMEIKEVSI